MISRGTHPMLKAILVGTTALAIAGSTIAYAQQRSDSQGGQQRWQPTAEDLRAFGEARLAALKAGLALSADQEKNWPAYEQAARDLQKLRSDRMSALMATRGNSQAPAGDPVERMRQRSTTLSAFGSALQKLADAADPLYKSLDDGQKRRFAMLSRLTGSRGGAGFGTRDGGGFGGREGDRFDRGPRRSEGYGFDHGGHGPEGERFNRGSGRSEDYGYDRGFRWRGGERFDRRPDRSDGRGYERGLRGREGEGLDRGPHRSEGYGYERDPRRFEGRGFERGFRRFEDNGFDRGSRRFDDNGSGRDRRKGTVGGPEREGESL